MIKCPTCGTDNLDSAVFCSQCATNITGQGTGVKYNPYAHAPPPSPYAGNPYPGNLYAPGGYSLPSRSSTILTLGILALVVCGIMGPIAWAMGSEELRRIDEGLTDPTQRGTVVAGRVCGIVATVLMGVSLLFVVYVFAMAAGHSHRY
ncbi:MAG TPA: zinc-ribbon domain-containing protein [Kofleriaceae bacterium]|nr:zinc-ribbon domain-containing protein [Kofleriaceae bacterium]